MTSRNNMESFRGIGVTLYYYHKHNITIAYMSSYLKVIAWRLHGADNTWRYRIEVQNITSTDMTTDDGGVHIAQVWNWLSISSSCAVIFRWNSTPSDGNVYLILIYCSFCVLFGHLQLRGSYAIDGGGKEEKIERYIDFIPVSSCSCV